MDGAQFAQVMQAVNHHLGQINPPNAHHQQRHKIEKYSSGDPAEWSIWRSNFVLAVTINEWDNQRARREAAAAMVGNAKMYVDSIAINDAPVQGQNDAADYTGLLNQYEAVFVPEAASDLSRMMVKDSLQREDETILQWHSRLRYRYKRAYPNLTQQQLANDRALIDHFIHNLRDDDCAVKTQDAGPQTYQQALEAATRHTASNLLRARRNALAKGISTRGSEMSYSLHAMGQAAGSSAPPAGQPAATPAANPQQQIGYLGTNQGGFGQNGGAGPSNTACNFCKQEGHFQRECRKLDEARRIFEGRGRNRSPTFATRGRYNGGRRRGRGRTGFRGRGGRGGRGASRRMSYVASDGADYQSHDGADEYQPEYEAQGN